MLLSCQNESYRLEEADQVGDGRQAADLLGDLQVPQAAHSQVVVVPQAEVEQEINSVFYEIAR